MTSKFKKTKKKPSLLDHPRWTHLPKDSILKQYPILITNIELLNALARMEESCRVVSATIRRDLAERNDHDTSTNDNDTSKNEDPGSDNDESNEPTKIVKTEYWNIFVVCLSTIVTSMQCSHLFNRVAHEYKEVTQKQRRLADNVSDGVSDGKLFSDKQWYLTMKQWLDIKCHLYFLEHNRDLVVSDPEYANLMDTMSSMERLTLLCSLKYCMLQLETILDKLLKFLKTVTTNSACLTDGSEKMYSDDIDFVIKVLRNFAWNMDQETMVLLTG